MEAGRAPTDPDPLHAHRRQANMKLPSVRRLAVAAAALSLWGAVRRHRKNRKPRMRGRVPPPEWPSDVRAFIGMLRERGVRVVTVRREDAYGPPEWVVEWGRGRSLTFPDLGES
jgi:hypothetical protein